MELTEPYSSPPSTRSRLAALVVGRSGAVGLRRCLDISLTKLPAVAGDSRPLAPGGDVRPLTAAAAAGVSRPFKEGEVRPFVTPGGEYLTWSRDPGVEALFGSTIVGEPNPADDGPLRNVSESRRL